MEKIGLIAGKTDFPVIFAKAAKAKGLYVVAVGIEGETKPDVGAVADKFFWVDLGELSKVLEIFKSEGIRKAVMAGGITKSRIFNEALKIDGLMKSILVKALDRRDDTLLSMITSTLKSAGVELLDSTLFLEDLLPAAGVLAGQGPSQAQEEDIRFGTKIAKEIAGLDVGLSIFVKDKAVIAVEDIEGTDAMIRRAGRLAGPGGTVIKVARPKQSMKFELPVIGPQTIVSMAEAKASCLAIEANKTLIIEKDETLALAGRHGIAVTAVKL
ncbi:MAG TPA: UDP-2,3-diacylglucosamine diphosphatase LpxI [Candidatus Omnitrophota bacterium]|nr:UDP-2,3-diacylglucosamine diphosphatase LpxI [Candidatus Omnitrophota bacterium]HOX10007.1 UDP-2,3-diacylglucosamine diphosphatase LpxI [Candidatus Omnitrophota bacterium]HPN66684.1 UDP-2,3-diacylglucosamine diphosphatase LpxI [Candidatus Omnitrophota bacterium]